MKIETIMKKTIMKKQKEGIQMNKKLLLLISFIAIVLCLSSTASAHIAIMTNDVITNFNVRYTYGDYEGLAGMHTLRIMKQYLTRDKAVVEEYEILEYDIDNKPSRVRKTKNVFEDRRLTFTRTYTYTLKSTHFLRQCPAQYYGPGENFKISVPTKNPSSTKQYYIIAKIGLIDEGSGEPMAYTIIANMMKTFTIQE